MIICPICFVFYKPDDNLTILKCGHSYHNSCISTWFQSRESGNKCPACRKKHTGKLNPVFLQFEADTRGRNPDVSSSVTSGSDMKSFREELAGALVTEFQKCQSSSHSNGNNVDELLKKVKLESVEAQFNDLMRQLNEQKSLVTKSQSEVTQLRNLGSEKDSKIGAMTNQIHSANAALRHNREEHNILQRATDSLRKKNSLLKKRNAFLESENQNLAHLRPLKPIKQLLDQKNDEIAKRVESFRNLSKNHDNPLELLVNYCVLVDCEVKDEIRKNEALRRELNRIKGGVASIDSNTVSGDPSKDALVCASVGQNSNSSVSKTESTSDSTDDLCGTMKVDTDLKPSSSSFDLPTQSCPVPSEVRAASSLEREGAATGVGCSFWSQERPQSEESSGYTTIDNGDNDEDTPEWLPPILHTRNRKNAVIQAPATTTVLALPDNEELSGTDSDSISTLSSDSSMDLTDSLEVGALSPSAPSTNDNSDRPVRPVRATRAIIATPPPRAHRRKRALPSRCRRAQVCCNLHTQIVDVETATNMQPVSSISATVSLVPTSLSSPPTPSVGLRRKRRKFESRGTTFQIVDDELSIEAPEVVSLLSDEEDETNNEHGQQEQLVNTEEEPTGTAAV